MHTSGLLAGRIRSTTTMNRPATHPGDVATASPLPDASGCTQQTLRAADGYELAARFFSPNTAARASVVIAPAMGVAQPYYAALAGWLARHGLLALTFDYRGTGLSRREPPRHSAATVLDWARLDCAAALEAVAERAPNKPVYWIGHSLGGQIIPLVPNWRRVAKFITVATGSGYWRENAAPLRPRAWFLWHVLAPLLVPLFGYFPGKRLGIVGDLPDGVMKQWRRWCLDPEYVVGAETGVRSLYAEVRTPIVSLSFTDDEMMSARNIESMHGFYLNAPRTMKRLTPNDVGAARIGHFGFFRPEFADCLWRKYLLPELSD
jgi:predicted alpha/beta hydrolase